MDPSNRGRPKGSRNRLTNAAKEAIQMAFDKLGGVDRLVEWAKEDKANEFAFYTKIYPKLLPRPAPEPMAEPEPPVVVQGALVWVPPDLPKEAEAKEAEMAHRSVSGQVLRPPSPATAGPESDGTASANAARHGPAADPWTGGTGPRDDGQGP